MGSTVSFWHGRPDGPGHPHGYRLRIMTISTPIVDSLLFTWRLIVIGEKSSNSIFEIRYGVDNQQLDFLRAV
jgi:hypothetical protein